MAKLKKKKGPLPVKIRYTYAPTVYTAPSVRMDSEEPVDDDRDSGRAAVDEQEISIRSGAVSIDSVLGQLASIADDSRERIHDPPEPDDEIWLRDIEACEAATAILAALQDEGVADPENLRDLLYDYRKLSEQYKKMYGKYCAITRTDRMGTLEFCPSCGEEVRFTWRHCTRCGERIGR